MEKRIIQINCFGKVDEVVSSLREVISRLEEAHKKDIIPKDGEVFVIASEAERVVLKVLK